MLIFLLLLSLKLKVRTESERKKVQDMVLTTEITANGQLVNGYRLVRMFLNKL